MKSLLSLGLILIIMGASHDRLQEFINDPSLQDQIIEYIVGHHPLMSKVIDQIMKDENKRQMIIQHLSRGHMESGSSGAKSPYSGYEGRDIKALSAEQIKSYLEGEGMGFAMPAELNHYPGPRHILDLAPKLNLSEKQQAGAQQIYSSMHTRAIDLGKKIVEQERALDEKFASAGIDEVSLKNLTQTIGSYQGDLRFTHLQAHLRLKKLLTVAQVARYDSVRGYGSAGAIEHMH